MKVLVTGSNGQLGKTIKERYASSKDLEFIFSTKSVLDITNKNEVDIYFKENDFDYCINCAAYTNVEKAEDEPKQAFLVNSEAAKNIALACEKYDTILIHISTDYVFNGESSKPYKETDALDPINIYGASKLAGEQHIKDQIERHFIIRTSWLYSKFENNFLNTIVKKVKNDEDLKIISSQKGAPTCCDDLAEFLIFLISEKRSRYGIYHFTGLGEASWYDFGRQIASNFKWYNLEKIQAVNVYKTKAKRPKYSVLSLEKVQNLYPKINLWIDSVNDTVQSLKTNRNN